MSAGDIGNVGTVGIGVDDACNRQRDAVRPLSDFFDHGFQHIDKGIEIMDRRLPACNRADVVDSPGASALDGGAANIETDDQAAAPFEKSSPKTQAPAMKVAIKDKSGFSTSRSASIPAARLPLVAQPIASAG